MPAGSSFGRSSTESFDLKAGQPGARAADKVPVTRIDAAGSPPVRVFATKLLTAGEIRAHDRKPISLTFKTPGGYLVETRLFWEGVGTLIAGPIRVEPAHLSHTARLPTWVLECLWIGGTIVVGWIFLLLMRRSRASAERQPAERPEMGSA